MNYRIALGLGIWLVASAASAASCTPTPSATTVNYPGESAIPYGNNLLLPPGKAVAAGGQALMLIGHLYDSRCVPISGAVIEMWQANPFGKWVLATPADMATPYPTFAGAGRATTDNDGQFIFTTSFPAATEKRAPSLNVRIYADGIAPFSTVFFFGNDRRNGSDDTYRKGGGTSLRMGQLSSGQLTGSIDVVLPGRAPYRTY